MNVRKATGPDGITGRVLRSCADQLAGLFTSIFNESLATSVVPTSFKKSVKIPVPKNSKPSCLNDYRPVALTSTVMKVFERLLKKHICSSIPATLDPLQFAYRPNRSTDDAISQVLHSSLTHIDSKNGNYVRLERVSSFKYLGVNISEDLTWTTHIQTQVKKARQRLYHLRQLRKFRVSPAILKTFYSGAIESVLTQCISVWYGNSSNQDCKALQRVVRLAERISGSALPSLQDIYLKRCKSRAAKIIKDSTHPGNHLFCLLPSGKRFRSMMAKTERLRRSFFPQAIRLLNINPVS